MPASDSQVALVSFDGKLAQAIGAGRRVLYFRGLVPVSAVVIDARAEPEVPAATLAAVARLGRDVPVVYASVEEGKTISEPLGDTDVFPAMVVQMIAVGEQTGALDTMLSKIAEFYEEEVDIAVAGLMKLLEPIMIAILGVVIGGIVIAMYMPMFSLISQLG